MVGLENAYELLVNTSRTYRAYQVGIREAAVDERGDAHSGRSGDFGRIPCRDDRRSKQQDGRQSAKSHPRETRRRGTECGTSTREKPF